MERQKGSSRNRSDDEDDKYRRGRDGDKVRSVNDKIDNQDAYDRRGKVNMNNISYEEIVNDRRRRDLNRDRSDDLYANDGRDVSRYKRSDDGHAKNRRDKYRDESSDNEDDNDKRGHRNRDRGSDDAVANDRSGRGNDLGGGDDKDGSDKWNREKVKDRMKSHKHDDSSDEEAGEFGKAEKKNEDMSVEEDGEIVEKKKDRKSNIEEDHKDKRRDKTKESISHDVDDKYMRRDRNRDGRNGDDEDHKDRGRDKHKDRSSIDEDDKYKRRRNRRRNDDDDEDIDIKGRDGRRVRSNGGHKDTRKGEGLLKHKKRGDKENLDDGKGNEGARFQKVAKLQEGMTSMGKSGGVYIPPFKLARMMSEVQDKSSMQYQRMTWDALRKSINGLINKVNATNIKNIIPELFAENLIRGRGLFCRSCMKSQMACPGFTDVFAALVAVVNTKFPEVGDLLLRRIILQLQRAFKRNDKCQLLVAVKFIAHLVNQQVVHELIALELLTTLLENPTADSVEVAVGFVTECGSILQDLCPRGLHGIFERFRGILHEGEIDKRVQFLIEGLFALRKGKFQGHPAVRPELDLVELEDQLTHEVSLLDQIDQEFALDIFKMDPNFLGNEKRYEDLKKTILGDESVDEEEGGQESDDDEDDESSEEEEEEQMRIRDETETNLVNLKRTIYLTIMSSVSYEEAGHKLLKIKLEPGQEMEVCVMLLECCSQERTYLRYYGVLGQRFCMINKVYQENFEKCFAQQYSMIHRLETNKLRNVAKFFAHLLGEEALPWHVLAYIQLTEEDTTSSSRIFIKILFQELSERLGICVLNERLSNPTMQADFESIFPRDNPKNTRFSINFFTSIGLGGITENLREYLKNMPRLIMQQKPVSESSGDSDSSSSSESGSSSESQSDSRKRRRR